MELNIGDIIRDVEDSDCYFEGVVVEINPVKYRITSSVWNGEIDNSANGLLSELKWWELEKLHNNKWIQLAK